ncbi:hypothetical protein BpHYR1_025598 [Brachionus plicatilis]|uniref:Uncharacterized protein n=1 Tax=Brachionus plicatilis TaxID=10195 RepID=A0A3M7QF71_BRAPC|nr:hypothetical protein BpHYR1_025598 [Brachionus plicatilis]
MRALSPPLPSPLCPGPLCPGFDRALAHTRSPALVCARALARQSAVAGVTVSLVFVERCWRASGCVDTN